ncbi:hypothetical protein B0H13DRAFT_2350296 [Mycena leptocephala]|nr:hypothetical protein B0H13DRAFT_2350296 [Mycena leptocephala]
MPLPQELVHKIVCQLDVRSLKACSLAGSPFRHTSQRILLRSITLDGSTRPSNCIAAHALLTESPRVAAYITRLTIFLPSKDTIAEEVEEVESLVQILSRLTNDLALRKIRIFGAPDNIPET